MFVPKGADTWAVFSKVGEMSKVGVISTFRSGVTCAVPILSSKCCRTAVTCTFAGVGGVSKEKFAVAEGWGEKTAPETGAVFCGRVLGV